MARDIFWAKNLTHLFEVHALYYVNNVASADMVNNMIRYKA